MLTGELTSLRTYASSCRYRARAQMGALRGVRSLRRRRCPSPEVAVRSVVMSRMQKQTASGYGFRIADASGDGGRSSALREVAVGVTGTHDRCTGE